MDKEVKYIIAVTSLTGDWVGRKYMTLRFPSFKLLFYRGFSNIFPYGLHAFFSDIIYTDEISKSNIYISKQLAESVVKSYNGNYKKFQVFEVYVDKIDGKRLVTVI